MVEFGFSIVLLLDFFCSIAWSRSKVVYDGKQRTGSRSTGGLNYYSHDDELLAAIAEEFKSLTGKLTKDFLLCLVKDSLSRLEQAQLSSTYFEALDKIIDNIGDSISNNIPTNTKIDSFFSVN